MTKNHIIKVGLLVAYDWELLKNSIPRIYNSADIICLAIDINRVSWSYNKFKFDNNAFNKWVAEIDVNNKIKIYEDEFSLKNLNARENCNRQRTMLADYMGKGGWHIQLDADEYFIDFNGFVDYLKKYNSNPQPTDKPINICVNFIPLFKKTNDGYLFVDFENNNYERIPLATNCPIFIRARQNGHFNHVTNHFIIHETWARNEVELRYKLSNWGHSAEELKKKDIVESYLKLWNALDSINFKYVYNFHPAVPTTWPKLNFEEGKDINNFIENIKTKKTLNVSALELFYFNSRNIARIRFYFKKLYYVKKN
jgi:hypothetical protein